MKKTLVIALGGNALGKTPLEQLRLVENTASAIVDLIEEGYDVVIGHGNGPQVGMVNNAFEKSHQIDEKIPDMPFPECGAMTQGYIGYHLQQAIGRELKNRKIDRPVVTLVTQVEVDPKDPAFQDPSKPIGSFIPKKKRKLSQRGPDMSLRKMPEEDIEELFRLRNRSLSLSWKQ